MALLHPRKSALLGLAVIALGTLLIAACGGGGSESGSKTTAAKRSPTAVRAKFDFGDAMDPNYPTKLDSDGVRHKDVTPGLARGQRRYGAPGR